MSRTIEVSNRTAAAVELYRRAYLLLGDVLEFNCLCQEDGGDEVRDAFENYCNELESAATDTMDHVEHAIGLSVVLDLEADLKMTPSTLTEKGGAA